MGETFLTTDLQVADIIRNARLFGEAVDGFLRTLQMQLTAGPLVGNAFLASLKRRVETTLEERSSALASIGFTQANGGILFDPDRFKAALLADAARVSAIVEDARRQIGGLLAAQQEGMVAMMTSVAHGKPAVQLGTVSAQVHNLEQKRRELRQRAATAGRALEQVASQDGRVQRQLEILGGTAG